MIRRPAMLLTLTLLAGPVMAGSIRPAAAASAVTPTPSPSPEPITMAVTPTESESVLVPGWLADQNGLLCAQAQFPRGCTTEQLQERTGRKDVRIFASISEWLAEVGRQALATAAQQQATKLRALAESTDAETLRAAARKELGLQ